MVGGSEERAELAAVTGTAAAGGAPAAAGSPGVGVSDSKRIALRTSWCSIDPLAEKEEKARGNQTR